MVIFIRYVKCLFIPPVTVSVHALSLWFAKDTSLCVATFWATMLADGIYGECVAIVIKI